MFETLVIPSGKCVLAKRSHWFNYFAQQLHNCVRDFDLLINSGGFSAIDNTVKLFMLSMGRWKSSCNALKGQYVSLICSVDCSLNIVFIKNSALV